MGRDSEVRFGFIFIAMNDTYRIGKSGQVGSSRVRFAKSVRASVDPSSTLLSTFVEAVVVGSGCGVAGTLLTSWAEMWTWRVLVQMSMLKSNTLRAFKIWLCCYGK